jgi:flagellar hook-associated protein 1 FlgK
LRLLNGAFVSVQNLPSRAFPAGRRAVISAVVCALHSLLASARSRADAKIGLGHENDWKYWVSRIFDGAAAIRQRWRKLAGRAIPAGRGSALMGLSVALHAAVSGLFANQQAIAATSENIANVNTANFTRREARFVTDAIPNQFAGVDVEIARAAADRFLQGAALSGEATASFSTSFSDALSRIEAALGAPGDNLSPANKLDDAFAALINLTAAPSSTAAKASALSAINEAFAAFARVSDAVATEQAAASGRIADDAARATALLRDVYRFNLMVADSPGAGDRIDTALAELSTIINVEVARDDQGRATVSIGGVTLADAGGYRALSANAGPPAALFAAPVDPDTGVSAGGGTDITAFAGGGRIGGNIAIVNVEAPRFAAAIDAAARAIATRLNAEYSANVATGATAPSGAPLIVEANGVFSVDAALLANPASFAIARPAGGAVAGANDASGAAALAGLSSSAEARGAGELVARIGASAGAARSAAASDRAFADEASARLAAGAGVNLDEELSNLILYQRAYGANARVISAVDELWRTLLDVL